MKKLELAIMLGLGVMVSGCGNQQPAQQQYKNINENNVTTQDLQVGDKFYINCNTDKLRTSTIVNGRKIVDRTFGDEKGVTMYIIDVTEYHQSGKFEIIVDNVSTQLQDAQLLKMGGLYTGTDEKVQVKTIYAHIKAVK